MDLSAIAKPALVGGIPLGIAAGLLIYFFLVRAITAYQAARQRRREQRRGEQRRTARGERPAEDRWRCHRQVALRAGGALILGIGTDLIDIRRVERTLARFGARFRDRVFTETEQARAERNVNPAAAYAKRYAAKEACAKALGTGFRQRRLLARHRRRQSHLGHAAYCELRHGAAARLAALTPPGMVARIDLSLTDEPPYAPRHGGDQRVAGARMPLGDQPSGWSR